MAPILRQWGLPVHDPFAGTGERMGDLCDTLGLDFTGTEIQAGFIIDPRVEVGNSRHADPYPEGRYCVATSVVYPNGMTDHFQATNTHGRRTYRTALAAITGGDEPLHPDNMGRHGPRQGKLSESRYWDIAKDAVAHWPPRALVNISDVIMDKGVYPAVDRWTEILQDRGYQVEAHAVGTPRYGYGQNSKARVDHEMVLECYWRHNLEV
jgi:hypothetical protein